VPALNGVIFDLGNTLIYFDGDWSQVYTQADIELARFLQATGLNLDEDRFLDEFRTRLREYHNEREAEFIEYTTAHILRTLLHEWGFSEIPDEIITSGLEAMYRVSQAHWKPEEDALPTIQKLKAQGYLLGLISNAADDADVQTLVDKANLRPYFEVILSSAAAGIRKPHPEIFQRAMSALKTSPSHTAMVGDTLEADILGAKNAGMVGIWITRRVEILNRQGETKSIKSDAVINRLSELPEVLEAFQDQ
jgi:HAD superfamily hydrolase (TIGR01662 family)